MQGSHSDTSVRNTPVVIRLDSNAMFKEYQVPSKDKRGHRQRRSHLGQE